MTDNTIRDQFTEIEENPNLSQSRFYLDSGGLNIGYGYDLTTNSNPVAALQAAGFGTTLTPSQIAQIQSTAAIPASQLTSAEVNALNTSLSTLIQRVAGRQHYYRQFYPTFINL